jgi:hypothetical protein
MCLLNKTWVVSCSCHCETLKMYLLFNIYMICVLFVLHPSFLSQPHFEASVKMRFTLPKVGTWSPPRLLQLQSSISEVKTPRLEVFFILLERP